MRLAFTEAAWEDYLWLQARDRRLLKRTNNLIRDALRSPFEGIGKPEPLRGQLSGHWSRRIDDEHRLVYRVGEEMLLIVSCRFHYSR